MTFELDTSGFVWLQHGQLANTYWEDLAPFTQGYVRKALESAWPDLLAQFIAKGMSEPEGHEDCVRPEFSDLAPSTLEAMMKDCAAFARGAKWPEQSGQYFWMDRQRGDYVSADADRHFPPLTLSLGDDGLIYAKGTAA